MDFVGFASERFIFSESPSLDGNIQVRTDYNKGFNLSGPMA